MNFRKVKTSNFARRGFGETTPKTRIAVSRALAAAMVAQRSGREVPATGKRAGIVDRRSLTRVAVGDGRIFKTRSSASVTRTRFVVILDCSGSMNGERFINAAQSVWDIFTAASLIPTARAEVWVHTTGSQYLLQRDAGVQTPSVRPEEDEVVLVSQVASRGTTVAEYTESLRYIELSGNMDGYALEIIDAECAKTALSGERTVYVMVSDGQPAYAEGRMVGMRHTKGVIDGLRRKGRVVMSVSVASALDPRTQREMYGTSGVVRYDADSSVLIRSFAKAAAEHLR